MQYVNESSTNLSIWNVVATPTLNLGYLFEKLCFYSKFAECKSSLNQWATSFCEKRMVFVVWKSWIVLKHAISSKNCKVLKSIKCVIFTNHKCASLSFIWKVHETFFKKSVRPAWDTETSWCHNGGRTHNSEGHELQAEHKPRLWAYQPQDFSVF